MSGKGIELGDNYYADTRRFNTKLAVAKNKLSKSLDIIAGEEADKAAAEFLQKHNKTLAVELQKRAGKTSMRYRQAVVALGTVEQEISLLQGELDIKDKEFEEFRSRNANRRAGLE